MFHILKLIFMLVREVLFDPGESDFKSNKFNPRKFVILLIIMMSVTINIWLISRFYDVATELHELKENPKLVCEKNPRTVIVPTADDTVTKKA